jgi:hypothetical protein
LRSPGIEFVRELYRKAYRGELKLSFNIWNIGEVLDVLDRAKSIKKIIEEDYIATRRFILETIRLARLRSLILLHVKSITLK